MNDQAAKAQKIGFLVFVMGGILLPLQILSAAVLSPISYAMPNGHGTASGGQFNYWDRDYTGSGNTTTDAAPLSGGLGDLTDGIIATDNWNLTENNAGTGPYVGWVGLDPTITFEFATPVTLETVRVHVDDANGFGNVSTPSSITVSAGAISQVFPVADPAGSQPFWIELDVQNLGITQSTVALTLTRNDLWVFASEVEFIGIPEPATLSILALGGTILLRRRPTPNRL